MLSPPEYERLRADKRTYVALRDRLRDAESELTAAGETFHTRTYSDGR